MARTFSGALVPAVNADGSIQWQEWQYEELLAHLNQDLSFVTSDNPTSAPVELALTNDNFMTPEGGDRNGAFAFAASTWTALPVDTKLTGLGPCVHMDTAAGGYRAPTTGAYLIMGGVLINASASNQFAYAATGINGVLVGLRGSLAYAGGGTGIGPTPYVSNILHANANDLLQVFFWNNVANNLAISTLDNYMEVLRVG